MGFWNRAANSASDPWLGMTAVFVGGAAWAAGVVALGPAAAVAGGMYAVGAIVGGLMKEKTEDGSEEVPLPQLHRGTEQSQLVNNLDKYLADLRTLRAGPQPDSVVDPSIQAVVATENAYGTAVRVAAAIDGLDVALSRSGAPSNNQQVREAVQRMADRRGALLEKLHGTVDEVAEVYTKLLEMSATLGALDVGVGASDEVEKVNGSLDSLRTTLAELEADARKPG